MKLKKNILISSFDLAIGGVERSLIGLLHQIDYSKYDVDLMLFKQEGEFFSFLPSGPRLLPEIPEYTTFRKPIRQIMKEGHYQIGFARLAAKVFSSIHGKMKKIDEPGYLTIQYGWNLTVPLLPKLNKQYDAAIGFLWPHYFIGEKVDAKQKIGWIHTDYANIAINQKMESQMWEKLDHIVAVSDDCLENFLKGYPACKNKGLVIENMLSPNMIREQARKEIPEEIRKVPGRTILVTVGRFTHAKGLDLAVKACRRLIDDGFDIAWYVAGYGPLENMLRRLIAECGLQERFILLGKKVNPYPYIHACDVYVQPSRYEGNAVTVREAQILQKPVVLTGFPTAKSQAQNGYDALITPLSVHGIAEGIKRMIAEEHLRERLISNLQNNDYGNEAEVNKLYQLIDNR